MSPDDPQHGTTTGYRAGCHEACCRRAVAKAAMDRRNRKYLQRTDRLTVDPLGTKRRIRALVALGWSLAEISRAAGWDRSHVALVLRRQGPLHKTTAARIDATFRRLSMKLPPETNKIERIDATRARNLARRNGWLPPLAWDNIDDPNERPSTRATRPLKTDIDPVVVQRVLAGDRMPTTRAEKLAITAAWEQSGRTLRDLEQLMGWRSDRYTVRAAS